MFSFVSYGVIASFTSLQTSGQRPILISSPSLHSVTCCSSMALVMSEGYCSKQEPRSSHYLWFMLAFDSELSSTLPYCLLVHLHVTTGSECRPRIITADQLVCKASRAGDFILFSHACLAYFSPSSSDCQQSVLLRGMLKALCTKMGLNEQKAMTHLFTFITL